jgi:7-alpha-hydroxysteroid dehydrogenase
MLNVGGGSIIMISSAIGHLAGRGYAMYGSVKAAVDHSVRQLSLELNPKIRVNAVAPGAILTEALATVMTNDDIRLGLENGTPLRRVGLPEDIAAAVLYLASPASSYVTGQIIPVDGGLVAPNLPLPLPDL